MKKTVFIFSFIFMAQMLYGQTEVHHNFDEIDEFDEEYVFDNDSSEHEIYMYIYRPFSELDFSFKGLIDKGDMVVTISDPSGKREGGFVLEARDKPNEKTGSTSVNGDMSKQIENPIYGKWVIRVTGKRAKGNITVSVDAKVP